MRKNRITLVFSTHLSEMENDQFIKHVNDTVGVKCKVVHYVNHNEKSLPVLYNKAIRDHASDDTIMVFCHPDIIFRTKNWGKILINKFNSTDYSIIGIAGTSFIPPSGRWWEDRTKVYGIVEHTNGVTEWVSQYSDPIRGVQPVVSVDGLFMAVATNRITHGFDERYGKFHFYDIPFCLRNYEVGCDVGVITDIRVLHKSIGETDETWERNREQFVEQYNLPVRHVSDDKLRVLVCCQFFKTYTGSEISVLELCKGLVDLGCDVSVVAGIVDNPLETKAKNYGIKVFQVTSPPNYKVDGKSTLQFTLNQMEFDVIHINHKPIGEMILQLYPNTPAVMHVRSEVIPVYEEPIIHPNILRYISIRETVTRHIESFGISNDKIVTIADPISFERFNTNYKKPNNSKKVVLFVGTIDHLRINVIRELVVDTRKNNQEFWIIGSNNLGVSFEGEGYEHVKYMGVKPDVEKYVKRCDYTAGIFNGRTTVEGFLCGKEGWVYQVDKEGNILGKELQGVPENLEQYGILYSAKEVFNLYNLALDEMWG